MTIYKKETNILNTQSLMCDLQRKCPCFKSALKAYVKWFLFSSEIMNDTREQQETLLNHLQIEDNQLSLLINEIKSLLDETGRIRSMQDRNTLVNLEIRGGLYGFTRGNDRIEIGVVKNDEEDKLTLYKDVFPLDLVIFVIQDKDLRYNFHIYDFKRLKLHPCVVPFENLEAATEELKENLNKQKITEERAKVIGGQLYTDLTEKLRGELSDQSEQLLWIYIENLKNSDDKVFDPIWEWLYTEEEDFFWGDRFHIIRISGNSNLTNSNFKIKKFAFVKERFCTACKVDEKIREDLNSKVKCQEIKLEYKTLKELNDFDCIHLGAYRETFEKPKCPKLFRLISKQSSLKKKLTVSNTEGANKLIFLFLNMISKQSSGMQGCLPELIDIFSPATWVDSSFSIPKKIAKRFVNCFYEVLERSLKSSNEANIVEIVAKTREKIKDQKNLDGNILLWRLVYVVHGNPCTMLTGA